MKAKKVAVYSIIPALLVSAVMLYVGFNHNAMEEFWLNPGEIECIIDWPFTLGVGLSWFIPAYVFSFTLLLFIRIFRRK
ncbi:hypothetical protein [Motiliproteus sp. MSK22-1]|uniref:hypothetical protein n=1 Tax=Motiliproteus sp. MSK22-1 TaxID=1897630 RepID=UPI000978ACF0|nr:hypothetical protein [Motiliproteus sp. MSK22-1]OMH30555.1 hypothetical protein BGP75_17630 [Motiliproteus sp. MSK22-1]